MDGVIRLGRLNGPIKFTTASICASKFSFRSASSLISATQASQIAFLFAHSLRLLPRKNRFHCTEGSDNCRCVYTCTYQVRAGRKNPPTSAHSLKNEWQRCSLTLAKHAEASHEVNRIKAWTTNSRPLRGICKQCGICTHKTWRQYVLKDVNEIGDSWKAMRHVRIIQPLWIAEIIRFFAVQVWIASLLCGKKNHHGSTAWLDSRRDTLRTLPRLQVKNP